MEEEIKKTEYKDIYELEQVCIRLTTVLKKRGMYKGFKDTLTKLYTKSGHFVFELIQNAEDCDAEEIIFELKKDKLIFKHDGKKLFTLANIDAITNVGNSTKNEEGNSIGKFGVGFKSVFEYTNTPEVHSGEYHFIIKDMYIPHPIENADYCSNTVFNLPFDISGKSKEDCFNEIGETLRNLNPETLLFLSHIKKIVCKIDSEEWILKRNDSPNLLGSKYLCTLSKNKASTATTTSTHYIRFFDTIKINLSEKDENDIIKNYEKKIDIGIAFKAQLNEKSGWSIKPIIYNDNPAGKVFTFFHLDYEENVSFIPLANCFAQLLQVLYTSLGRSIGEQNDTVIFEGYALYFNKYFSLSRFEIKIETRIFIFKFRANKAYFAKKVGLFQPFAKDRIGRLAIHIYEIIFFIHRHKVIGCFSVMVFGFFKNYVCAGYKQLTASSCVLYMRYDRLSVKLCIGDKAVGP
jgi:hypothetical protein